MVRSTNPIGNRSIRDLFRNGFRIPSSEYLFTGVFIQYLPGVQQETVLAFTTNMRNGIGGSWMNPGKFRNILKIIIQKLMDQILNIRILHLCLKQSFLIRASGQTCLKSQGLNTWFSLQNTMKVTPSGQVRRAGTGTVLI